MFKKVAPLFLLINFLISTIIFSQPSTTRLTLEDIYQNGTYRQKGFGPVRWMKDNMGYTTLEKGKEVSGTDIIRYDAATGTRSIEVNAKQLIPTGGKTPLSIADYEWSDDNSKLLVFTSDAP